ncbi:helix-hairpin-helix domain-containing protein [Haloferax sulfurifontis]|uniref:Uncharacterized protein n=2 Tax=Haloferax sulfurifontis TaxID=255616 RepID=M0IIH1_9EURY|nr:helix-hairpin-helix domain-containing protein [Haloferax sulfurifontis]ELZ96576.1 hypothetical protein C441_04389 [Haloferax sulfurifontis ATCC BAA-897]GGC72727.1 hypothetical protein GCM10007209_38380 [Haloferax sulfurifontis]
MTAADPWVGVTILIAAGAVTAYRRFEDWRTPDEGTREWAHQLYATGKIDERELERRLDVIEDPEAERIRQAVERTSGIGDQISWDIAARFDTLDDVRNASLDELTAVPNVGDARAEALKDSL